MPTLPWVRYAVVCGLAVVVLVVSAVIADRLTGGPLYRYAAAIVVNNSERERLEQLEALEADKAILDEGKRRLEESSRRSREARAALH